MTNRTRCIKRDKLTIQLLPADKSMDKAANEKEAEFAESSDGRKTTPYQRIVIACPENHIIVVKRFVNGGKKLILPSVNEI